MDEIRFADGFDVPERLVFGLGPWQLLVLVGGLLLCYAVLHAPIPAPLAAPLVVCIGAPAIALAWLRFGGRPAIEWALFAVRYAAAPRTGGLRLAALAPVSSTALLPEPDDPAPNVIPLRPYAVGETAVLAPPPAVSRSRPRPALATGAHRITFFSCRGGSGRTTLAAELAGLLAAQQPPPGSRRARRVALLDLDIERAALAPRLGLSGRTILDYALAHPDERRLTDFLCRHPSGVHVLAGPARAPEAEWPLTPHVVREILRELDLEGFDVVISDVSAHLSPITRAALQSADDAFVVVAPSPAGVQDAYRSTEALRRLGIRRLRYVVNRVRGSAELGDMVSDLGAEVIAEIPDDSAVDDAEQRHVLAARSASPAAAAMQRFAARVAEGLLLACAP